MHHRLFQAFAVFLIWAVGMNAAAQDATTDSKAEGNDDSAKIKLAVQSYVTAYNARNVEKLVGHWSPDGVYTSRTSGDQVVGRDAMTKEFTTIFQGDNAPKLAVTTDSIEFISPNVAVERGAATITYAEDDVVQTNYSVVYVKRDGAWLIDRVTEDEIVVQVSNYEHLKKLEWLIGVWNDEGDGTIELDCGWTRGQNFINRTYKVFSDDQVESSGMQIIGWDPVNNQIRSWLFDSDGGFVSGTWTQRDDKWIVQSIATLADGGQGSYTSILRPMDDGSYAWKKINQVVDGELLPNLDEIIFQRK